MRAGRFSLAVIAACIIATAVVPPLREMVRTVALSRKGGKLLPTRDELDAIAKKHPADIFIQLAMAETPLPAPGESFPYSTPGSPDLPRLRRVVSMSPKTSAPHLRLAVELLAKAGGLQREEECFREAPPTPPKKRNPEQEAYLNEAIEHLRIASVLASDNAAPDFLLAYAMFAKRADSEAEKALQAALSKPAWTLYSREMRQALLTLYEESRVSQFYAPIAVLAVWSAGEFPFHRGHRFLARLLVGLAEKNRLAGRHGKAIFYYQSAAHLGRVMLKGADSILDVVMAAAVVRTIAASFISEAERQEIKRLNAPKENEIERLRETEARNFWAYLTAHGRADLAEAYEQDIQSAKDFERAARAAIGKFMPRMMAAFASRSMAFAVVGWMQAGYILILLVLTGILSLLFCSWKEKGRPPLWRWWEWSVLLVVACAPSYVATVVFLPLWTLWEDKTQPWVMKGNDFACGAAGAVATGALLLFILIPIVGGLRKLRRQPPEARLGRFRACLASFRILLPPTFAVLLAVALMLTVPAQMRLQKWADEQKKIIQQGEVKYWEIGQSR